MSGAIFRFDAEGRLAPAKVGLREIVDGLVSRHGEVVKVVEVIKVIKVVCLVLSTVYCVLCTQYY